VHHMMMRRQHTTYSVQRTTYNVQRTMKVVISRMNKKGGTVQAWTVVFPPAKPSHLSFSYSSGVLKSGSQYCLLLNMWQSRHRHSLSHFFFPLHQVWVNACSLVFFPPQFKQSAKTGSSLCFHLAAHSSTLMILNPWPMDGLISTGFPCIICGEGCVVRVSRVSRRRRVSVVARPLGVSAAPSHAVPFPIPWRAP